MSRYYTVGTPMRLFDRGRFLTLSLRELDQETVTNEAFETGLITRIFTDFNEAIKYAECLHIRGTFPKTSNVGADAPILTFEMSGNLTTELQTETIPSHEEHRPAYRPPQTISFYEAQLPISEVKLIRVEFPENCKIPAIDLQQKKEKTCSLM